MLKRALYTAMLTLSGCAGLLELPPQRELPPPGPEYQRIVAQSPQVATLRAMPALSSFQIAGLRPSIPPQPGEWAVCLRAIETIKGVAKPVHFGVFLRQWTVIEVRRDIVIDRCDQEQYAALAQFPAAKLDDAK